MLVVEGKSLGWIQVAEKDPAPAIGHSNLHLLVQNALCTVLHQNKWRIGASGD